MDLNDPSQVQEFVANSWYDYSVGKNAGLHPYDGETTPNYTGPQAAFANLNVAAPYSWDKTPRWKGNAMEVGPLARVLLMYAKGNASTRDKVNQALTDLKLPMSAMYSTMGRILAQSIDTQVIADQMQVWFDAFKANIASGDLVTHNAQFFDPATWPDGTIKGVGYTEAPRGALGHWVTFEKTPETGRQDPQLPVRRSHHLERFAPRSPRQGQCLRGFAGRPRTCRARTTTGVAAHHPQLQPVHGLRSSPHRRQGRRRPARQGLLRGIAMNIKYLTSIFAMAAATFAAMLPSGSAHATGTVGSSEFDAYCARQDRRQATVPQQSRPYRASGNSCALCHPGGNTNQFNTLGTATRSCTTTSCPTSVNSFCTNTAPAGTLTISAPAANATVAAGNPVTFTASGATDPDGFALTYSWTFSGVSGPPTTATGTSVTVTPTTGGTLTATLQVRDPNGATHATRPTRSVTVTAAPPANQAPNGSITVPSTVTQGVAATFQGSASDPENNTPFTYAWSFGTNATPATSTAQNPSVTFSTTGSRTVTLTVTDSLGAVDQSAASVTVTVNAPQPPVANADTYSVQSGQTLTVAAPGVLGNDTNPAGTGTLTAQLVTNPASGTLTLNANGSFTYVPTIASGPVSFTYRTTNGTTTSANATVTINVSAAPTPPVATNDTYSVQSGQTLTVAAATGVLGNDTNPAGTGTLSAQLVTGPTSGTLSLNANGGFTYTPATGFAGPATFTYRSTNGTTTSANATVTINVAAAAQPPVASADSYTVQSGQTLTVAAPGVLGNDSNPAGTGTLSAQLVTGPASGTLNLTANGSFTYAPAAGFTGNASFVYRVTNGTTTSANATVTISVSAAPQPPVANSDSYTVQSGQTLTVATPGVLGNDTNPAGTGTLSAQLVTNPTSGTLSLNANGSFTYTPAAGFTGNASFTYRVTNGTTNSANNATVTINVTAPPPPPPAACTDADSDGFFAQGGVCGPRDCNDSNAAINPGAREVCGDGIDNDCDGTMDSADKECNGTDCLARFFAQPVVITSGVMEFGRT